MDVFAQPPDGVSRGQRQVVCDPRIANVEAPVLVSTRRVYVGERLDGMDDFRDLRLQLEIFGRAVSMQDAAPEC
jgi:hypothetical protein